MLEVTRLKNFEQLQRSHRVKSQSSLESEKLCEISVGEFFGKGCSI